jgi:excisionase family DNA binding protein
MEPRGTSRPRETVREVLTIPEVAEVLRVTPKTVYGLAKRGALTSFRVGRALRCRRSDVERFMMDATALSVTGKGGR